MNRGALFGARPGTPRVWLHLLATCAGSAAALVGMSAFFGWLVTVDWIAGPDRTWASGIVAHREPALTEALRGITWLGDARAILPVATIVAATLYWRGHRSPGLFVAASTWGTFAITLAGKHVAHRPRPPAALDAGDILGSSLPSGHSALALAFCGALAWALTASMAHRATRAAAWALALSASVAVGFSRVYLGAHWPTDVLAAWFVAGEWLATLAWARWQWSSHLSPTRAVERSSDGRPVVRCT